MEETKKVKMVLIASGGGTDAYAIMDAYSKGFLPNVSIVALISTKEGAGCLEKAEKFFVRTIVIDYKKAEDSIEFNRCLSFILHQLQCQLVFLVGCVVHIKPDCSYSIYNVHPADIVKFGGYGMYGSKVHERVLENAVDLIGRKKKEVSDIFYTHPTVHLVNNNYDSGDPLMSVAVQIPHEILYGVVNEFMDIKAAAKRLQEYVLPYEWAMLPAAVNIAAMKILKG